VLHSFFWFSVFQVVSANLLELLLGTLNAHAGNGLTTSIQTMKTGTTIAGLIFDVSA